MRNLLQDFRYALRTLTRSPGFALIALATLALGIGANTAIFSVARAVLWKPLNFPHPDRLVALEEQDRDGTPSTVGFPTSQDWRARAKSFDDIAVMSYWNPTLAPEGGSPAQKLEGLRVSNGFFQMLGVSPVLGRDFAREEDRPNANRVVILGYGLWKRRFGGDPTLPGHMIRLADRSYLVAGILPRDFESVFSPFPGRSTEIWSPLGYDQTVPYACRDCRHLRAFAGLKASATLGSARAELAAVQAGIVAEHPADYPSAGVFLSPLHGNLTDKFRGVLLTLLAAVGFVLLIGCANIASLLLARAARRQREVAIRCALGASGRRIVQMFLAEALVLAGGGGLVGVVAASATLRSLLALAPAQIPRLSDTQMDPAVVLFASACSLASGLAFGLLPALRLARLDPEPRLREGSGGSDSRRTRRHAGFLVVFDAALVFVLLFGAALLVKSTGRLLSVDPGFTAAGVLQMEVTISGPVLGQPYSAAGSVAFYEQALERLRAIPGVVSAAAASQIPLGGNVDGFGITIEGRAQSPESLPSADRYSVTPDYLSTMRIPILRGRGLSETDRRDAAPVVLVNQTFAHNEFGGGALGHRVRLGDPKGSWRTIVGVVGDVRHASLDAPRTNQIYLPHAQFTDSDMVVVLRTSGQPDAVASEAVAAIRSVDPNQPVTHVATMERLVETSASSRLFAASLLSGFAALAMLLAAMGVFGVVSGFVAGRRREMGIRIALGARPAEIFRMVAGQAVALAAAGVAAGLPLALAVGHALKSQLYDVSPSDFPVLAAVGVLALVVALCASLLPTRRASRIDPVRAMRGE